VQSDRPGLDDDRIPCALNASILGFCGSRLYCDSEISAYLKELDVSSLYVKLNDNNLAVVLTFNLS
jgi:hypothetical protein